MTVHEMKLPAVIDMAATHVLRQELLAPFHDRTSVRLDASSVGRIGTPGLQLLWSASISFEKAGLAVSIVHPSEAFMAALKDAAIDIADSFLSTKGMH